MSATQERDQVNRGTLSEGHIIQSGPDTTPVSGQDIEEGTASYNTGGFHPVYLGDIYGQRYEILRKIGYGQYSTVWLVKDLHVEEEDGTQYRALKILSDDAYDEEGPLYEREILTHLREADRTHIGYEHICHLLDDFVHEDPNGSHVCLIFEPIGETLHTFHEWFNNLQLPNLLMRKFAYQLLIALDYAHDNGVIHTDIKPDNIFVKSRDTSLITKYLDEVPATHADKTTDEYNPIRSQPLNNYYFLLSDSPINLDICLGDWGVSSWTSKHLCEVIQPVGLRSPEVLIGAPWDWTTDWWNLGTVILEIFRGVQLFRGRDRWEDPYVLRTHLEEIVHFFGPFPRSFLDRGSSDLVHQLFNEGGTIKYAELSDRPEISADFYMGDLSQEHREDFMGFLRALMKIDP